MTNLVSGLSNGGPIAGESQTARIFSRLRQDIIAGTLEPGRKLKIEDLRRRYNAGASPLREALSTMCTDGLVERIDQRGFRVADIGVKAFDELMKTRCWLEERALRESIAGGGTDWEERVVIAHYRLAKTPRTSADNSTHARAKWEAAHRHFHLEMLAGCGSEILLKFCDQLYDQNIRYRNVAGTAAYPKRDVEEEHRNICEAVVSRDADRAVEALIAHYRATGDYLRKALVD
ncbi:MAG: GntR family transcriptional regulator [Hyphomicrobiales bacterium]|nr:GntR family transcriptional regulator [Hyphomicrobiales bacterium]